MARIKTLVGEALVLTPAIAFVFLVSPAEATELLPADRPIPEVVDLYVDAGLRAAGLEPSPQTDDATLVRRLTLDLAGRIPTAAEARGYVESRDGEKREQLFERLISSPDSVRHSATEFDHLLKGYSRDAPSLRNYLLGAFRENRPWDRMFRELIGSVDGDGPDPARPENFVLNRLGDRDLLTRDVGSVFFGINISCCQCHDHPHVASLTQDHFFGLKSFFLPSFDFEGRLLERRFVAPLAFKTRDGADRQSGLMFLTGAVVDAPVAASERDVASAGDLADLTAAIQQEDQRIEALKKKIKEEKKPPTPADLEAITSKTATRARLVELALRPAERRLFARAIVNRLWYRFFGHGLVMRVDQMYAGNPSSHPELLEWLARDFVAHHYDLRRITRGLLSSRTYSRSSRWRETSGSDPGLFAVANVRPLTPMQYGVSLRVASDPESLEGPGSLEGGAMKPEEREKRIATLEKEAEELYVPLIEAPHDDLQINVKEALQFSNDEKLLRSLGDLLTLRLAAVKGRRERIETAVWTVLSRPPAEEEIEWLNGYLDRNDTGDAEEVVQFAQKRKAVKQAKDRSNELESELSQLRDQQNPEATARVEEVNAELTQLRPLASQPLPTFDQLDSNPTRAALQQMVWALLMSPEFRFNH